MLFECFLWIVAGWLLDVDALVETKWFYEITWECPVNQCRKWRSIRAGSFFENSKIPLSHGCTSSCGRLMSPITTNWFSLCTVITALQRLRDICSLKILHNNVKMGGGGKTVEIDESKFRHKRKYNCGRISRGTWVLGMVERGTGRALSVSSTQQNERNLGGWSGTAWSRAWNNYYLLQVFTIL